MYKIEKGIKLPPVRGGALDVREELKETLPELQIGDSFLVKQAKDPTWLRSKVGDIIKKSGTVLAMRKTKDGTRVWKIGDAPRRGRKPLNGNGNYAR